MNLFNIAVLGSGGREHAIQWKLKQSPRVAEVFTLPGNGGIENSVPFDNTDFPALAKWCREKNIEIVVVGPEALLEMGIVDALAMQGIVAIGPSRSAARLESSKIFAKQFMNNYGVATARYETFAGNKEPQKITNFITELGGKCVIKFDGLAAGKGVFVCESFSEAQQALTEISARYGSEAAIVIEEKLEGTELSIIGITDGREIKLFQPSQDHKRLQENDRGPNTGGMGAYTPVASVTPQLIARINERIIQPTLRGISAQAFNYQGFIYFGIMISNEMPYLLEYNVRLGDPETQVLLPSLKTDLVEILLAVRDDRLRDMELTFFDEYFIDVVLVSEGYPGAYEKGLPISGLEAVPNDVQVFHAGTKRIGNDIVTDGGRVLNIVASDTGFVSARRKVYQAIERITFHGMQYRGDIGFRNQ